MVSAVRVKTGQIIQNVGIHIQMCWNRNVMILTYPNPTLCKFCHFMEVPSVIFNRLVPIGWEEMRRIIKLLRLLHSFPHIGTFEMTIQLMTFDSGLSVQFYFVFIGLSISNLCDSLFDSLVLVSCEQLKHLKEIMGPLIELSAALDTQVPNAEALFRVGSSNSKAPLIDENGKCWHDRFEF